MTISNAALAVGEGFTRTYTVVLDSEPTGDVTVTPVSGSPAAATVSPDVLTFTTSNSRTPQTVTVHGVSQTAGEGTATITHAVAGADYGSVTAGDVAIRVSVGEIFWSGTMVVDTAGRVRPSVGYVQENNAGSLTPNDFIFNGTRYSVYDISYYTDTNSGLIVQLRSALGAGRFVLRLDDAAITFDGAVCTLEEGASQCHYDLTNPGLSWSDGQTVQVSLALGPPEISIAAASPSVTEGSPTAFTVTAGRTLPSALTVNLDITADGGLNGDYGVTAGAQTVTIAAGQTSATHDVPTTGDDVDETDGSVTATVTVNDDETTPILTITAPTVVEGASGTTTVMSFTVTSSGASAFPVACWTHDPSGSAKEGTDYNHGNLITEGATFSVADPAQLGGTLGGTFDVTVNGDDIDEENETIAVRCGFSGISGNVQNSGTITDDDERGFTIEPRALSVAENAGTASYTVALSSLPTADVAVALVRSGDSDAATLSTPTLTFTTGNWNVEQTVTVTGVNDDIDNVGDERSLAITHTANGGGYVNVAAGLAVTITDDDTRGVTLATDPPSDPLVITVAPDGMADYTIVLNTEPTANVMMVVTTDPMVATVSLNNLTFTPVDWDMPQTVTVTGVSIGVTEVTQTVTGGDYTGFVMPNIRVTVADLVVTAAAVAEGDMGTTATMSFTVTSTAATTYPVRCRTEASAGTAIVGVDYVARDTNGPPTTHLDFSDPLALSKMFDVTVNGDDIDDDGETIIVRCEFVGIDGYSVDGTGTITDDDTRGITLVTDPITTAPGYALSVAENAGTASYSVVLDSKPLEDVTVTLAVTPVEGTGAVTLASSAMLTFTTLNWATAQQVNLTITDDDLGNPLNRRTATISHTAAAGDYGANNIAADLAVTVTDDDRMAALPEASGTIPAASVVVGATHEVDVSGAFTGTVDSYTASSDDTNTATVALVSGTTYRVTAVAVGTAEITVTATNSGGTATQTFTVTVAANVGPLPAPENLTAARTANSVVVEWDAVTTATSYIVQWKSGSEGFDVSRQGMPPDAYLTLNNLPAGRYTLRVAGVLNTVAGAWSDEVTTSTTTVTIAGGQSVDESESDANTRTGSMLGYTLTFSAPVIEPVTVYYAYVKAGTTAQSNQDFVYHVNSEVVSSGPLFDGLQSDDLGQIGKWEIDASAGSPVSTAILPVTVYGDHRFEADETVEIRLLGVTNAALGSTLTATNTIRNDDEMPEIIVGASRAVYEGNMIKVDVWLSAATDTAVTVQYHDLLSGTAVAGGSGTGDYPLNRLGTEASPNTLTFPPPGLRPQTVSIWAKSDTEVEGDETINLRFHSAVNATLRGADGSGNLDVTATILDEDLRPIVTITSGPAVAAGADAEFTLIAQPAPTTDLTVHLEIDATAGYVASGNLGGKTVTIPANQPTFTYSVATSAIDLTSTSGAVRVTLQPDSAAATPATASYTRGAAYEATVTVGDNDTPAVIVSEAVLTVGENGGTATYNVKLNTPPPFGNLTVEYSISDGNFITVSPLFLNFSNDNWTTGRNVTVTGLDNDAHNPGGSFATITHSVQGTNNGFYQGISINSVFVTVTDDDARPTLTVTAAAVTEGDMGSTTTMSFTVTSTGATTYPVRCRTQASAGTAIVGIDYVAGDTNGPPTTHLDFSDPLALSKMFDVTVNGDDIDDDGETIIVRCEFVGIDNYSVDGTGTITDDDTRHHLRPGVRDRRRERRHGVLHRRPGQQAPPGRNRHAGGYRGRGHGRGHPRVVCTPDLHDPQLGHGAAGQPDYH